MRNEPVDDPSPYANLSSRERVEITTTFLLCTAIVGIAACVLLFVLGHISTRPWVMMFAVISIGFGYVSQLAAVQAVWSGNQAFHGVCAGSLLIAVVAWVAGFVMWFLAAVL